MYIKLNGVDRTEDIKNYFFELEGLLKVYFWSNPSKGYSYSDFEVGPHSEIELGENVIIAYKNANLNNKSKKVILIGDNDICIDGKIYKRKNIFFDELQLLQVPKTKALRIKGTYSLDLTMLEVGQFFYRVTYKNQKQYVYKKEDIEILNNPNIQFSSFLEYYTKIAKIKDSQDDSGADTYLMKQMNKIIISDETSLFNFFKKKNKKLEHGIVIYPFGINLSQKGAINNALSNQLSIIQGPPGTGKTQSILNIIANCIVNDQSVAMVSSNGKAVRNVKEKMKMQGFGFLIAFLGKNENIEDFFATSDDLPTDMKQWEIEKNRLEILLSEIGELSDKIESLLLLNNKLWSLRQELIEYEHEQSYFVSYINQCNMKALKNLRIFKLSENRLLDLLFDLENNMINSKFISRFINFFKYGITNQEQFKENEDIINWLENEYYKKKIAKITDDIEDLEKIINVKGFDELLNNLTEKSLQYFKGFLAMKYKRTKERKKNYNKDTVFQNNQFPKFIDDYPIILSTTHAIFNSKSNLHIFDYLIVDEASQVELMPGIIALSICRNAVIVGDLQQLPHIPEQSLTDEQNNQWKQEYGIDDEYDYKVHSLLSSFVTNYKDNIPNTMLVEHYRCHEKIISFCNKKYYDGRLICYSDSRTKKPLVLLTPAEGNHMRYNKNLLTKGITNIRELESLVDKEFLDKIVIDMEDLETFGFMAPFRAQVKASDIFLHEKFSKDTVHKFQGREADIIIFSTVLDSKATDFLMKFVDQANLVNVAVSRAKKQFILVTDSELFKRRNGEIADLIRHMEYYEEDSILFNSNVRSIFDLLYRDYRTLLESKRKKKTWGRSRFDSENLLYDLLDSILIETDYNKYKYVIEQKLKQLFFPIGSLTDIESTYMKNNASVDVIIYNKFDNQPVLAIEVDGFKYHENNPEQLRKDAIKDSIFLKYKLPLLRLKTNHANEEQKIKATLDSL